MKININMKGGDQKIREKIQREIMDEIIKDSYKIKNPQKSLKEISVTLGGFSFITDAKLKALKELKKEEFLISFEIKGEEWPNITPPKKPSPLEIEYDFNEADKNYYLNQIAYDAYMDFEGEKCFIADIKYNPLKIRKHFKNLSIDKKTKLIFEGEMCRVSYGNKKYTPHRTGGRCKILKELWTCRRTISPEGKIKLKGSFKTMEELATAGNFVKDILEVSKA